MLKRELYLSKIRGFYESDLIKILNLREKMERIKKPLMIL